MIEIENKSFRGALIEVITKKIVLENLFESIELNELKEKLEDAFDLNLKFEVKVSEIGTKNGFVSGDIVYENEDGKTISTHFTICHSNEIQK